MQRFKYGIIIAAIISFGVGIVICLWLAATKKMTNNESFFMGVFVSLLSILASWLISHIYAELSVQAAREDALKNLRMYALKAAEKVTNLSSELGKLAAYLQQELDDESYSSGKSDLQGKNERIYSAIHVLQTLKSVNDGSLSDWEGVIGDELANQREMQRVGQEELAELSDRVDLVSAEGRDAKDELLEQLRREIRTVAVNFGGSLSLPANLQKKRKENVSIPCLSCDTTITYQQRPLPTSYKLVTCSKCSSEFLSRFDATNSSFKLESREPLNESVICPYCGKPNEFAVDIMPATSQVSPCSGCGLRIRIVRDAALKVRPMKIANEAAKIKVPAEPLTEELVSTVENALPAQPWEPGLHRRVAADLKLTEAAVRAAISELIKRGKFLYQFDGKLYTELKPMGTETSNGAQIPTQSAHE